MVEDHRVWCDIYECSIIYTALEVSPLRRVDCRVNKLIE